jgi:hypothetical protein
LYAGISQMPVSGSHKSGLWFAVSLIIVFGLFHIRWLRSCSPPAVVEHFESPSLQVKTGWR